ncbi:MAG TPA: gluconokinase [Nocardioidaceae bacterium]|nr:gluconokinase [Nocardioidaceae bacterium]
MNGQAPLHVVAMGVSGTGKSTVAARLAERLGLDYIEGDSHHPQANIDKMSSGVPLTDEDRRPWLETLARLVRERHEQGRSTVLTCSALRRRYRDILRSGAPDGDLFFVHLDAPFEVLEERMKAREHFMPPSLLRSQIETLEPLEADERGVRVDVSLPVDTVVNEAVEAIGHTRQNAQF